MIVAPAAKVKSAGNLPTVLPLVAAVALEELGFVDRRISWPFPWASVVKAPRSVVSAVIS